MKANELRIGNYIMFGAIRHQIKPCDILNLHKMELAGGNSDPYSPIPLTEEWLLKLGFTQGNKCYNYAYSIDVLNTEFYLRPSYKGGFYWGFHVSDEMLDCELNDVKPLEYVHQLQNLYFAFTGEELTLVQPQPI